MALTPEFNLKRDSVITYSHGNIGFDGALDDYRKRATLDLSKATDEEFKKIKDAVLDLITDSASGEPMGRIDMNGDFVLAKVTVDDRSFYSNKSWTSGKAATLLNALGKAPKGWTRNVTSA